MSKENLPLLPKRVLTEHISIKVEPELKQAYTRLRSEFGIDAAELFRRAIRDAATKALSQYHQAG